jgi:hypothetical protein
MHPFYWHIHALGSLFFRRFFSKILLPATHWLVRRPSRTPYLLRHNRSNNVLKSGSLRENAQHQQHSYSTTTTNSETNKQTEEDEDDDDDDNRLCVCVGLCLVPSMRINWFKYCSRGCDIALATKNVPAQSSPFFIHENFFFNYYYVSIYLFFHF